MPMLIQLFRAHGQLCASRPWEVIIGTVTLTFCVMSMSLFASDSKICGWNYKCEQSPDEDTLSSDVIILTLTRCIAVVYFYLQFRNLRKLGSKYIIGIAGLFTVFSSFMFSIGVINIFGRDLTGLNEALPFFLLLVDLSKACTLAKFALSSTSQDEVVKNIGRGMALLGPMLTLDALVETLVIGVGTLSGVKILQTMCCFGCLSIVANYLAFMTFYPACLALILELSRDSRPLLQIQKLAKAWHLSDTQEEPNPVTQRVKMIMSAGLVFVHAHSRLAVEIDEEIDKAADIGTLSMLPELTKTILPEMPLWQFYLRQMTSPSIDYILTLALAILLAIKYIVFDCDIDSSTTSPSVTIPPLPEAGDVLPGCALVDSGGETSQRRDEPASQKPGCEDFLLKTLQDKNLATLSNETSPVRSTVTMVSSETQTDRKKSAKFIVGDSSDESESDDDVSVVGKGSSSLVSVETQTEACVEADDQTTIGLQSHDVRPLRTLQECMAILKSEDGAAKLTDDEVLALVNSKQIAAYRLETVLDNHMRGVGIRRRLVAKSLPSESAIEKLPYSNYDYTYVHGSCCENVVGYVPVPVGVVGPLQLDGKQYTVPMATTEGCLLASTNRGCRAVEMAGGAISVITKDGMSRAPVVRFDRAGRAHEAKLWLEDEENYRLVADAFNSTSRFARVKSLKVKQIARSLHLRFTAFTGDAMGMNMVSKGCEKALGVLKDHFPDMQLLSLSGNFCTDKKPSAVNWVEGRGKSVVCDAVIPSKVVREVLKTSTGALVDLNKEKNLMGSAAAGSIGGFNAHASNVVTAIYIATGQDPAQNVCSSDCITVMEATGPNGDDLYVSCTMPCIEVGTIGGGTVLPPQTACLEMLGVCGSNAEVPGANAQTLARVICATVLAAELSLMAALATGDLVKSHLTHNRSVLNMAPNAVPSSASLFNVQQTDIGSRTPRTCLKS